MHTQIEKITILHDGFLAFAYPILCCTNACMKSQTHISFPVIRMSQVVILLCKMSVCMPIAPIFCADVCKNRQTLNLELYYGRERFLHVSSSNCHNYYIIPGSHTHNSFSIYVHNSYTTCTLQLSLHPRNSQSGPLGGP